MAELSATGHSRENKKGPNPNELRPWEKVGDTGIEPVTSTV